MFGSALLNALGTAMTSLFYKQVPCGGGKGGECEENYHPSKSFTNLRVYFLSAILQPFMSLSRLILEIPR
jgi:hypothetical protein